VERSRRVKVEGECRDPPGRDLEVVHEAEPAEVPVGGTGVDRDVRAIPSPEVGGERDVLEGPVDEHASRGEEHANLRVGAHREVRDPQGLGDAIPEAEEVDLERRGEDGEPPAALALRRRRVDAEAILGHTVDHDLHDLDEEGLDIVGGAVREEDLDRPGRFGRPTSSVLPSAGCSGVAGGAVSSPGGGVVTGGTSGGSDMGPGSSGGVSSGVSSSEVPSSSDASVGVPVGVPGSRSTGSPAGRVNVSRPSSASAVAVTSVGSARGTAPGPRTAPRINPAASRIAVPKSTNADTSHSHGGSGNVERLSSHPSVREPETRP